MNSGKTTVITGGTVVDGSGQPARLADVAFVDGVITEVAAPGEISTAHAHQHIKAD